MSDVDTWMDLALQEARAAADQGEVPVGAVLIRHGEVLARAHNLTEQAVDPTAHAEMLALRAAAETLGDWRLDDTTLVVTLEPCPMCVGAIVLARVERLVYGARDPRYGACGSALELPPTALTPHLREIRHAHRADECGAVLQDFFRGLRQQGSTAADKVQK